MKYLQTPFKLGKITLPNNVFYSPLAGCSDFPFRQMSARYNPGLQYCEMVKMDALIRHDPTTFHILDYEDGMHPIGAQLVGSKVDIAGKSAKILEDLGFDVIDLNCGCPVDKVTKDGSGSGLLKNPEKIADILCEMVAAVNVPVTVKIRAGWDEGAVNAEEITRLAEQAGAAAIAIHGRTRKQAYRGSANWDYIKACKEVANQIKVIGNGDVFSAEDAERMFAHTGCDAVLVSRGTMGRPWIAEDIVRHLSGLEPIERTLEDDRTALLEHYRCASKYHSDRRTVLEMRKVGCWYLKKSPGTRDFRGLISKAKNLEEVRELIENYELS